MKPGSARTSVSHSVATGSAHYPRSPLGSLAAQMGDHVLVAGGLIGAPFATLARLAGARELADRQRAELYRRWLAPRRWQRLNVLIVGLGVRRGRDGIAALDLWRAWLPRAEIAAIDAEDETRRSRGRAQVYQCTPVDKGGLERIARIYGGFDVVIDTGAESDAHALRCFELLSAHLRPGGLYFAERPRAPSPATPEGGGPGQTGSAWGRSYHAWLHGLVDDVTGCGATSAAGPPDDRHRLLASIQMTHGVVIVQRSEPSKR